MNHQMKKLNEYYWGDDWEGEYPDWDDLTEEQMDDLQRLKTLIRQSNLALIDRLEKEKKSVAKLLMSGAVNGVDPKENLAIPLSALDKLKKKLIKEEE